MIPTVSSNAAAEAASPIGLDQAASAGSGGQRLAQRSNNDVTGGVTRSVAFTMCSAPRVRASPALRPGGVEREFVDA